MPANAKDKDKPATADVLWKELIRVFFKEFLMLFKPDLLGDIILNKVEFLEKELISLTGKKKKGIVDVLVKVYLKNGNEEFILFHIEVQGNFEENFPERMFSYYIRIWDKYKKPVTSQAIIIGDSKKRITNNTYNIESYGTELTYKYNLVDITMMEYSRCVESDNPVEVAVSILIEKIGEPKWKRKITAIKRLEQLGLEQDEINLLLAFIDRLLPLNKHELEQFEEYIQKEKKEVYMIMTSWEERGLKRGIQKGLQKGRKERDFEIAKAMLRDREPIQKIVKYTGLNEEEIKNLRKN